TRSSPFQGPGGNRRDSHNRGPAAWSALSDHSGGAMGQPGPAHTTRIKNPRSTQRDAEDSMKAVCWMGTEKISVENVPDPEILNPRDAIVKITSTCICGSDLHLYNGLIPTMEQGDILGHEFMG